MKLQTIVVMIISFLGTLLLCLGAVVTYAMDWQREQDTRMSGMDKLMERQSAVLEMQVDINEQIEERRMFLNISPAYEKEKRNTERND